ncbi:MAG: pyridoxamine 5-phosphate oxidase-related FMN-binding protein [Herbinix sp.]|jgi:uncharacterized pyridoxamine 5'-phosphate oxidase family protein|nr:pyridoxamine 5-phosphate oxidase-related FMN-binding protein [Herbinix sp.]
MNEVLQLLLDNPVFYIATVEGDKPKVRPFGFVMNYEGKLCFCTNNKKHIYKQLKENPNFEISTTLKTGGWIRLKGKAVFNTSTETKTAAIEASPALSSMYRVDDSIFEIFYVEDGEATIFQFDGSTRTITL